MEGAAGDVAAASEFCEATREKGEEFFGEGADNLTGVLPDLGPMIEAAQEAAGDGEAGEERRAR